MRAPRLTALCTLAWWLAVGGCTTFDDESFSMLFYTGQVTRTGYDTMTGIGTPAGQNFVYALRKLG